MVRTNSQIIVSDFSNATTLEDVTLTSKPGSTLYFVNFKGASLTICTGYVTETGVTAYIFEEPNEYKYMGESVGSTYSMRARVSGTVLSGFEAFDNRCREMYIAECEKKGTRPKTWKSSVCEANGQYPASIKMKLRSVTDEDTPAVGTNVVPFVFDEGSSSVQPFPSISVEDLIDLRKEHYDMDMVLEVKPLVWEHASSGAGVSMTVSNIWFKKNGEETSSGIPMPPGASVSSAANNSFEMETTNGEEDEEL